MLSISLSAAPWRGSALLRALRGSCPASSRVICPHLLPPKRWLPHLPRTQQTAGSPNLYPGPPGLGVRNAPGLASVLWMGAGVPVCLRLRVTTCNQARTQDGENQPPPCCVLSQLLSPGGWGGGASVVGASGWRKRQRQTDRRTESCSIAGTSQPLPTTCISRRVSLSPSLISPEGAASSASSSSFFLRMRCNPGRSQQDLVALGAEMTPTGLSRMSGAEFLGQPGEPDTRRLWRVTATRAPRGPLAGRDPGRLMAIKGC